MFSLDLLLIGYGKWLVSFILINKVSLIGLFYILQQGARKTKTTIDDSILTFLKNIFLRIIGKGFKVENEYYKMKDAGLLRIGLDPKTLKYLKEQMDTEIIKDGLSEMGNPISSIKPPKI